MNELVGRLVNLGYDFFGVVLPGAITATFLWLVWVGYGELLPFWTSSIVPSWSDVSFTDARSYQADGLYVLGFVLISYFLGHVILWGSRLGKADEEGSRDWKRRMLLSLKLRIPKPTKNYDDELAGLFDASVKAFRRQARILSGVSFIRWQRHTWLRISRAHW